MMALVRWFGRPFSRLMPQLKALALKRRSPSRRGQEHPRCPLPFSLALSQQFWLPETWIKVVWTTGPALKIFNGWKVAIAKTIELFKLGKEVQLVILYNNFWGNPDDCLLYNLPVLVYQVSTKILVQPFSVWFQSSCRSLCNCIHQLLSAEKKIHVGDENLIDR